jgi:class 3 adenylate cyclase
MREEHLELEEHTRTDTFFSNDFDTPDDATDVSSSEIMSIKGKGCIGCIEDIPLFCKLLLMNILTFLTLLGFGIYLIYLQGYSFRNQGEIGTLVSQQVVVSNLLNAIGMERKAAATLISSVASPQQIQLFNGAVNNTNTVLAIFAKSFNALSIFGSYSQLQNTRKLIMSSAYTGYGAFNFYSTFTDDLITWTSVKLLNSTLSSDTNIASISLTGLRMFESVSQMSALGNYLFGVNFNGSDASVAYSYFITQYAKYDSYLELFNYTATNDVSTAILDFDTATPGGYSISVTQAMLNCYSLISNGYRNKWQSSAFDTFGFDANVSIWLNGVSNVTQFAFNQATEASDDNYKGALIALVVIVVLIIVMFILGMLIGLCFSKTITGPWQRVNKLQRSAIKKFVPAGFLKLLDCKSINDVQVGKHQSRNVAMVQVEIKDFDLMTKEMDSKTVLTMLNGFLSVSCPVVRENGGFIERYHFDGFSAVFKSKKAAINAAVGIQAAAEIFSSQNSNYPKIQPAICVHAAKVLVATVGEDERMDGVIASREARFTSQFLPLNGKIKSNIIASSDAASEKMPNCRKLGVSLDRYGNEATLFEIFDEKEQVKKTTKNLFNEATKWFSQRKYYQALKSFLVVKDIDTSDQVVEAYIGMCNDVISECDKQVANLDVPDIMKSPILKEKLYDACKTEFSTENYDFLSKIIDFSNMTDPIEMRKFAIALYDKYCDINGDCAVNITETAKQIVKNRLDDPNYEVKKVLFDGLHKEMLLNLGDTSSRLQVTTEFKETYMEIMTEGRKPML